MAFCFVPHFSIGEVDMSFSKQVRYTPAMKSFIESKTIWANVAAILVVVIGVIYGQTTGADLQSFLSGLGVEVGQLADDVVIVIVAAVNIALRFKTNKAIVLDMPK